MSYQLWNHQGEAIDRAKKRDDFALFFETGTGKTATAIHILSEWVRQEQQMLPTLVLCPPIIIRQWGEEIRKFSNLGQYVTLLIGTGAKRAKLVRESNGPRIYIANYETLLMKECFVELLKKEIATLIVDESQKIKSMKAKRTKQTIAISSTTKKRIIMTGSPVLNSPADLFSQYLALDKGRTFGKNFFVFRSRYFYDKNAGMPKHNYFPDWRPRPGMEAQISKAISVNSMSIKKAECLDLPPLVRVEIPVEMSKEQKTAYDSMKDDMLAYIGSGVAVANMALTKLLRLQQIVSGFASTESLDGDKKDLHEFEDVPRVAALEEVLESIVESHKVIVWACFSYNYRQIRGVCERLGVKFVEITGERTELQKKEAVESFQRDADVRVCIANPKAGGVGLNLVEASYAVYFSRTYSLEDDLQSEARNYRGGSERHDKITRIDLVTRGSVDEVILQALKEKQNLAEKILDFRKYLTN